MIPDNANTHCNLYGGSCRKLDLVSSRKSSDHKTDNYDQNKLLESRKVGVSVIFREQIILLFKLFL